MISRAGQVPYIITPRTITSASATLTTSDMAVICKGTANQTLTLPTAASYAQRIMYIKQRTTYNVTINRAGSDTIDGATSHVLVADGSTIALFSTGTEWLIVGSDLWVQDPTSLYQNITIPLLSANAGTLNPATLARYTRDSGGSSEGVYGYSFTNTANKELLFNAVIPFGYKAGLNITPNIQWTPASHTSTGTVKWGLEYVWKNVNGTWGTTSTVYATQAVDSTSSGADKDKHLRTDFTALTGTSMIDGSMLLCRLFRDVSVASNLGAAAYAFSVGFRMTLDGYGSIVEAGD